MELRPARAEDLPQINDLYNHYIRTSYCTFDLEEHDDAWRLAWFERFGATGRHRLLVAVEDAAVLGYAYSGKFRDRAAYDTSVEVSVYIADGYAGRGIGTALYTALFDALRGQDVHRAYAGVSMPNDASVALHIRHGFTKVALFTEQGRKFGRYWDVAWFEKAL